MHAGTANAGNAGDGTRKLTFKTAVIAGVFDKLAGAQRLLFIHYFEAKIILTRDTDLRQFQARHVYVIRRHQNRTAVNVELELHFVLLKDLHHAGGINVIQAAVKWAVFFALSPQHHRKANGNTGSQTDHQTNLTNKVQITETFSKIATKAGF